MEIKELNKSEKESKVDAPKIETEVNKEEQVKLLIEEKKEEKKENDIGNEERIKLNEIFETFRKKDALGITKSDLKEIISRLNRNVPDCTNNKLIIYSQNCKFLKMI